MVRVRIPSVQDVRTAIRLYYEKVELRNADIIELFGCSKSTALKLKERAREEMSEQDMEAWDARAVNTECAFTAWGIEIADLERRYSKLRKYGLLKEGA